MAVDEEDVEVYGRRRQEANTGRGAKPPGGYTKNRGVLPGDVQERTAFPAVEEELLSRSFRLSKQEEDGKEERRQLQKSNFRR